MDVERTLRTVVLIQGLRALLYGFGTVLLGTALAQEGLSDAAVGAVFTAMLAGMALASVLVGRYGDRVGRRRLYTGLLALMGVCGAVFAVTSWLPLLLLVSLSGTLSTDPNESGPITSLEQAMLGEARAARRAGVYARYNAVAYLAGSVGALAAAGPAALRRLNGAAPAEQRWLLAFLPVALLCALLARRLPSALEVSPPAGTAAPPLHRSRTTVRRLAALFALDSFGGGFIVQSFVVFWFHRRFGTPADVMGTVLFAAGLLQAGSSIVAGRVARRIGLLNTMVFTHLPSNILLALIPVAPTAPAAIALLLARFALSQMDVPARQAYVVAMVDPTERTAAAAYTNTARYVTRPLGPVLGGALMRAVVAGPFLVSGLLKIVYDAAIYAMFRRVPLPDETVSPAAAGAPPSPAPGRGA